MKKKNLSDALNNIDFDMVEDVYESAKAKKKSHKSFWHQGTAVAACLTLIIIAAVAVVAALPFNLAPNVSVPENPTYNTNPSAAEPATNQTSGTQTAATQTNGTQTAATQTAATQAQDPSLYVPKEFTSIEEFVAYEKSLGANSSKCYYIPSALGDDYELYSIMRQVKNQVTTYEHITVKYKLKGADIDEGSNIDLNTKIISCEYSVREYSDIAFENYTNNGFEAFERDDRQLYKLDIYSADKTTLLSYRVIFRIDGHLIGMRLPAIDSFENMMKYTDVIRVDIE